MLKTLTHLIMMTTTMIKQGETIVEPIIPEESENGDVQLCSMCQRPADSKVTRCVNPADGNGLVVIVRYCNFCTRYEVFE